MGLQLLHRALTDQSYKPQQTIKISSSSSKERDWSELLHEILPLIFKKLLDLTDLLHFRAVCKQWRSAARSARLSYFPPQLPWFLTTSRSGHEKQLDVISPFYGKIPKIDVTKWCCKTLIGSWSHYILSFDSDSSALSLINPLTGREIALPSLDINRCDFFDIKNDDSIVVVGWNNSRNSYILGLCRIGDEKWELNIELKNDYSCFAYDGKMIYVHYILERDTEVLDATTGSLQFVIPAPIYTNIPPAGYDGFDFCMESCGKLLAITFIYRSIPVIHELKFDGSVQKHRWIQTNDIGDQFLLFHRCSKTCADTGLSLRASDFFEFRRNCIYIIEQCYSDSFSDDESSLVMYDIKNGLIEERTFDGKVMACFFPSSLFIMDQLT